MGDATYAWAVTRSRRRRCGNRDERDAPGSNSAFTRHGIDAQRRRVLQRHMRVARCGGWMGGGGVRVRVEDLEETCGQEHTLAVLLKK